MKLSDAPWEPETALGRLGLEGQDLASHEAFWDRSAKVDAIRSIADQETKETFDRSGVVDAEALRHLLSPEAVFLEIGCGIGRVLQHVAPMCREAHGVDISAEMVKQGEDRLGHIRNLRLWHGNGYDLELFEDDRFDVVYCGLVFQHMPKTTVYNYLVETYRVLKPDGVFRFQVPNILRDDQFDAFRYFTQPYFVHHPYPMHFYTPAEVVQLATKAGFFVEELTGDIQAQVRKRGRPGVAPEVARSDDLSLLEGDNLLGMRERSRQLEEQLARIKGHPVIRTGLLVRDGLRRLRGSRPR
jgi:ubiquinone/menaquinone biosynthesis C-methylase UbiE